MGCGGYNNAGDLALANQRQQQQAISEGTQQIGQAFAGFNPAFYQGVQQAYQNFAMPQLEQEAMHDRNQLGFKLAGQGLGDSSVGSQAFDALANQTSNAQTQIANQGLTQAQQLQQQIGQQKQNLLGQLQTASDPSAVAGQAINVASGFGAPSSFAPIGSMLNNFATMYLGSQAANNANNQLGMIGGVPSTLYANPGGL